MSALSAINFQEEMKLNCNETHQQSNQKQIKKVKINWEKLRQYFYFSRLIVK